MTSIHRYAAHLGIALCLCGSLALAAPPDQKDEPRAGQNNAPQQHDTHGQQPGKGQAQNAGPSNPAKPGKGQAQQSGPSAQGKPGKGSPAAQHAGHPPADFKPVRQSVHEQRHLIGRGPALPSHVHIVKGKPLPPGYGKRLPAATLAHLPHYPGYEWRRVGSDMVLITISTGLVYEILAGVLD